MIDHPRLTDHAIWILAVLLYTFDAARLLSPREMLLVEAGGGNLTAVFGDRPFTITGRVLTFGALHLPHRGMFVAPWGRAWTDHSALAATLDSVRQLRLALLPARIVAVVAAGLLFVVGPLMTMTLGPGVAVLCTAALLYPTVTAGIVTVWARRHQFRLKPGRAAVLSMEMLLCPAFLPNLVRKITAADRVECDGAQILAATASPAVQDTVFAALESRTENLLDEVGPGESDHEDLRSYLSVLRRARS